MKRNAPRGGAAIPALAVFFALGLISGWWLRSGAPMPASVRGAGSAPTASTLQRDSEARAIEEKGRSPDAVATTGEPLVGPEPASAATVISDLRRRELRPPIDRANMGALKGHFEQRRDGGERAHEAVDILAPRHTPVHAVEDGVIAKLFTSRGGGITVYQFDPTGRFCYYYAHLERYTDGMRDGQPVRRGDVLGYVGTSGNAPPNTPHLHFAIFELDASRQWWKGRAVDPYLVFANQE
jgi:murein DD-endopeptidase MepM/ murein hydrolase activator NlpD